MGIQKQASVSEQLSFDVTFLKIILDLVNKTNSNEALQDFTKLRDLVYSPGETGYSVITQAVLRRRAGRLYTAFDMSGTFAGSDQPGSSAGSAAPPAPPAAAPNDVRQPGRDGAGL